MSKLIIRTFLLMAITSWGLFSHASIVVSNKNHSKIINELGDNIKLETGSLIVLNQRLAAMNAQKGALYRLELVCRHEKKGQDSCKQVSRVDFRTND